MVAEPPAAKPEDQYEQLWVVGAGGEAPAPPPRPATEAPAPPTTNKAAPSFVPPPPATVPRDESSTAPVGSDQTSTRKNSKIESREKSKKPKKKTEKEEKDETSEMGSDMGSEIRSAKKMKKKERHEKKEVEEFTATRRTPKWAVPCFIFCLLVCFVGTGVSIVLAGHQWLGWAMIEAFVV